MNNQKILEKYKKDNNLHVNLKLQTCGNWKKQGYSIKKGEKCKHKIALFSNNKKDNIIIKKMCYLFDETQVTKK